MLSFGSGEVNWCIEGNFDINFLILFHCYIFFFQAEPPVDVVLKDTYVGNKGQDLHHLLAMDHPIKDGLVTNWEDMEVIWNSVLNDELQINPQEHLMMLNEPAQRDKPNREKMAQVSDPL